MDDTVITVTVRSYVSDVSHLHREYKQQSRDGEHEQEDAARVLRPRLLAPGTVLHVCLTKTTPMRKHHVIVHMNNAL